MSEPEDFLKRWSRRKREAAEAGTPEAAIEPPRDERVEDEQRVTPPQQDDGTVADLGGFDIAKLPSVDSINADTDIRDFLRPGVPPDLTREALRRAWNSDPAIRDYIGPVENGWDFNDPNAIPGFGTIEPSEIPRLLGRVIGALASEQPKSSAQDEPMPHQNPAPTHVPLPATPGANVVPDDAASDADPSRRDGNAAPQGGSDSSTDPPMARTSRSRNI